MTSFRGLPKPGEVTTEFAELARIAREEAEAPLAEEEIPRRYREGIRDWFESLESEATEGLDEK